MTETGPDALTTCTAPTDAPVPTPLRPAGRGRLVLIALAQVGLWVYGIVTLVMLVVSLALVVIWVGLPMLLAALAMLRGYASAHRSLAGRVLGVRIASPYRPGETGMVFARLRGRLTDGATWRDIAWLFESITVGLMLHLTALVAFLVLPLGYYGSPFLLRLDAAITRVLIGPSDERLRERISRLESSRADTVDHSAAELRRIERDLHDGAQAQLVALGMNLGLAEELIQRDPGAAAQLVAEARASSSAALADLRSLVRGIHPPVLADRGLVGGVEALALAHPVPVEVDVALEGRPPEPVESAVYFAVAEVLTNSAKHAAASQAWVWLRHEDGVLVVMIGDDGVGGAAPTPGGGLDGLERRLAAFDGTIAVTSPLGGPTIATIKVPCALRADQPVAR